MRTTTELAIEVYRLASGSKAPEKFVTWFNDNIASFNLSEEDLGDRGLSRASLNRVCDLAEEAGFEF